VNALPLRQWPQRPFAGWLTLWTTLFSSPLPARLPARSLRWSLCGLLLALTSGATLAATQAATPPSLNIAVASNFIKPAAALASVFETQFGIELNLSPGATSKHSIQIAHGAPYDVFLAADSRHPQQLIAQQLAQADSVMTYAIGQLALWAPRYPAPKTVDEAALTTVLLANREHIAIANPKLAPYGLAAEQTLHALGLWETLQPRLLRAENVAQSFQYVAAGGASIGFVARAQLQQQSPDQIWPIPNALHAAITQQAVIVRPSHAARQFMQFLASPGATLLIRQHGYHTPDAIK